MAYHEIQKMQILKIYTFYVREETNEKSKSSFNVDFVNKLKISKFVENCFLSVFKVFNAVFGLEEIALHKRT